MTITEYRNYLIDADDPHEMYEYIDRMSEDRDARLEQLSHLAAIEQETNEYHLALGSTEASLGLIPEHLVDARADLSVFSPDTDFAEQYDPPGHGTVVGLEPRGRVREMDPYPQIHPSQPIMHVTYRMPFVDQTTTSGGAGIIEEGWAPEATSELRIGRLGGVLTARNGVADERETFMSLRKLVQPPPNSSWTRFTVRYLPRIPGNPSPRVRPAARYMEAQGAKSFAGASICLESSGTNTAVHSSVRSVLASTARPNIKRTDNQWANRNLERSISTVDSSPSSYLDVRLQQSAIGVRGGYAHCGCVIQITEVIVEHFA